MTARVKRAHDLLEEALDPNCDQPWMRVDDAKDLLEKETKIRE